MKLEQLNARINQLAPGESLRLEGLNSDIYHASTGYGSTSIKKMCDCPAVFKEYIDNHEHETTDDQIKGSAIHCLILEPFDFEDLFCYQPEEIKTRSGKVWKEWKALHDGYTILRPDWPAMINGAVDSVLDNFRQLFSGGRSEVSFWRRDLEFPSVILKGRLDYQNGSACVDLKTTVSVEPAKFGRDAKKFGYHVQDSMYSDIAELESFVFVAVEKKAPFMSGLFEFSAEAKQLGFIKYRAAVASIAHCQAVNEWPGYTTGGAVIDLTPWELKELEELEE